MSASQSLFGTASRLALIASLPWTLTFCSESERVEGGVGAGESLRHPVEAFSPYRELPAEPLVLHQTIRGSEKWEALLAVDQESVVTVGGDSLAPFSDITHLVRFQDGFAVGDNGEARVHVFGRDGSAIAAVGRSGEGPAEFRRITAISQIGQGVLAVADVMRRVELFEMTDSLRHLRSVRLPFSPTSLCTMGEKTFAYASPGADTLPPIRVLDAEWKEQARIGQSYKSPNPLINSSMGEVALICAPKLDRLVVIPRAGLGDVYILAGDGAPIARFLWSDYQSLAIIEDEAGFSATIEPGGLNRFRSGTLVRDSLLLLQYDFVSEEDFVAREGPTSLHSVLINLATGEILGRSSDWPALLSLASGGAVEQLTDDWPGVRVYPGTRN